MKQASSYAQHLDTYLWFHHPLMEHNRKTKSIWRENITTLSIVCVVLCWMWVRDNWMSNSHTPKNPIHTCQNPISFSHVRFLVRELHNVSKIQACWIWVSRSLESHILEQDNYEQTLYSSWPWKRSKVSTIIIMNKICGMYAQPNTNPKDYS